MGAAGARVAFLVAREGIEQVEAGVVSGRQLTSWPGLRTDYRNAGAEWVDAEVV